MAEPELGVAPDRRLLWMAAVGVVLAVLLIAMFFRTCSGPTGPAYTTIYSQLDLKDMATVAERLKELKIPYQLREEGRGIAVPRGRADEARLGLAAKNIPTGGVVGFEIFEQPKFGATDFDRQVQFVRAISGELSRTIRRIEGVADCRVQIVIPKTQLFAAAAAPVTASVLLELAPGKILNPEQINGIVHLVSSSVENLSPENVTLVDINGNILNAKGLKVPSVMLPPAIAPPAIIAAPTPEVILKKEVKKKAVTPLPRLAPEEELKLALKTKESYEDMLSDRAQSILNRFYPPNTTVVRVNVELGSPKKAVPKVNRSPKVKESKYLPGEIKRISVIILVDSKYKLTRKIKNSTYKAVAAAVGYQKVRGDHIELRQVPFVAATMPVTPPPPVDGGFLSFFNLRNIAILAAVLLAAVLAVVFYRRRRRAVLEEAYPESTILTGRREAGPAVPVEQARHFASEDPEKVAALLKKWLAEEREG